MPPWRQSGGPATAGTDKAGRSGLSSGAVPSCQALCLPWTSSGLIRGSANVLVGCRDPIRPGAHRLRRSLSLQSAAILLPCWFPASFLLSSVPSVPRELRTWALECEIYSDVPQMANAFCRVAHRESSSLPPYAWINHCWLGSALIFFTQRRWQCRQTGV